ncbi:hypothetical protein BDW22DRAFT_1353395 [Trametopsis cervina]|nr:hypothetical protein BDW22DRAFT_1353395 [Trametopsis cervina]
MASRLVLPMLTAVLAFLLAVSTVGATAVWSEAGRPCAPGSFSSTGRSPCQPCPAGAYAKHWSSLSCTQAELGHYVPLPGSSISLLCEPGYYSARGSSYCSPSKNAVFDQADLPSSGKKIRPLPAKTRPCAFGLHHCPVYGQWQKGTFLKGFECIDTQHELESCGGCVHNDSPDGEVNNRGGQDCSAITGVDTVRCVQGRCVIDKCAWGYAISADKLHCRSIYGKY